MVFIGRQFYHSILVTNKNGGYLSEDYPSWSLPYLEPTLVGATLVGATLVGVTLVGVTLVGANPGRSQP